MKPAMHRRIIEALALAGVLVPYKFPENRELLLRSGFRYGDIFFKWYNFSRMVAVKIG